jgi:hypothetical protein
MKTKRKITNVLLSGLLLALSVGCGGGEDIIVKTADGAGMTAADIDRDPLALLPAGATLVGTLDAQNLFASSMGQRLLALLQARLPLPASVGFEPRRDLSRLYVGLYSFQGVDFAGVAAGNFNRQAIEEAANGTEQTPLGSPLVRVQYAGRVFYVSANVGFVVLTEHTVVYGNETGIRRVLDRMEAGRVKNELGPELNALMLQPGAPIAFGVEPGGNAVADAAGQQQAFLRDLSLARVIGDFESPGVNAAGTLTYKSPEAAVAARDSLASTAQNLSTLGTLLGFVTGQAPPLRAFNAATEGTSVQVTAAFDATVADHLIGLSATVLGLPGGQ